MYGRHIHVENEHKPLEALFKKPLFSAPARLQRMLMELQKYNHKVISKGQVHTAGTLNRAHLKPLEDVLEVNFITLPVSEEKLQQFRAATAEDAELKLSITTVLEGWPATQSLVPDSTETHPQISGLHSCSWGRGSKYQQQRHC